MASGDTCVGNRVGSIEDLVNPGDYYLNSDGPAVWFLLPRIEECPADENQLVQNWWDNFWTGTHRVDGTWAITEYSDGTVGVSPSIRTSTQTPSGRIQTEWHGFLEHGVWREA